MKYMVIVEEVGYDHNREDQFIVECDRTEEELIDIVHAKFQQSNDIMSAHSVNLREARYAMMRNEITKEEYNELELKAGKKLHHDLFVQTHANGSGVMTFRWTYEPSIRIIPLNTWLEDHTFNINDYPKVD